MLHVRVASPHSGGRLLAWLDAPTAQRGGIQIATCSVPNTGDWNVFTDASCPVSREISQPHDLYFVFENQAIGVHATDQHAPSQTDDINCPSRVAMTLCCLQWGGIMNFASWRFSLAS